MKQTTPKSNGTPRKRKFLLWKITTTAVILALLLTQIGYHVIKAQNSKDAIVCAEAEEPALIFMDVELPDVDGIRTSALLKQNPKTSHIPIVALTAWMSELWREKASKVGIKTYLQSRSHLGC
jgi:CheY-like chemotaxis protein